MLIPRHWSRASGTADDPAGKRFAFQIWGWSQNTLAEAALVARRRLAETCERVARGGLGHDAYFYGKAPLREEIVASVGGTSHEPAALITRNRYGALVLNTARVPFIDVDAPQPPRARGLAALFGRKAPAPAGEETLARIRAACSRAPQGAFRVYRTAAGFRVLASDLLLDPPSEAAQALLADFGADPFFIKLCKLQGSFRARLTPKPWRCGCSTPPSTHPREDERAQRAHAAWLQKYETAIRAKATCALVETHGPGRTLPEAELIVAQHDRACRVGETLPLA